MRSHARATPLVQAAVRFDCFQLLIARKRDAVEGSHFIERPVLRSFHARAVVTEDVNNEGVVGEAHVLDRLHDAADSVVGVFLETRVNFHLTRIHLLNVRWYAVPSWEHRITGRKLGVGGNHSELLLSCKRVLISTSRMFGASGGAFTGWIKAALDPSSVRSATPWNGWAGRGSTVRSHSASAASDRGI